MTMISIMAQLMQTVQKARLGRYLCPLPLVIDLRTMQHCIVQFPTQRKIVSEKLAYPLSQQLEELQARTRCSTASRMMSRMITNFAQSRRGIFTSRLSPSLSSLITFRTNRLPNTKLISTLQANSAYRKARMSPIANPKQNYISTNHTQTKPSSSPQHFIFLLSMRIRIDRRTTPHKGKTEASPLRQAPLSTENEESPPSKLFRLKFSRFKSCHSKFNSFSHQKLSCSDLVSVKVLTEAETNDIYESDFEKESQRPLLNETVKEQNSSPSSASNLLSESSQGEASPRPYQYYSQRYLIKRNKKLIDSIQFIRLVGMRYRMNIAKLQEQQRQLRKLRALREKAMGYTYELELDLESASKVNRKQEEVSRIKQCSMVFKKHRYQVVQEAFKKANPTIFQMQKNKLEASKEAQKIAIQKAELLSKKRQFYRNEEQLKLLDQKSKNYASTIDIYDSFLSRGSISTLEARKLLLLQEVAAKKTMLNIHEIELNTEITSTQNSIVQTEARLMRIRNEQKRIKEAVSQVEEERSQALVASSESSLQPPRKLVSLPLSSPKCSSKKTRTKAIAIPYSHSTQRKIVQHLYSPSNRHTTIASSTEQ